MKHSIFSSKHLRHILYSIIIVLPSVFTGNLYNNLNNETSTENLLNNLSALSMSLYSDINDSQTYISYSLSLLLSLDAFSSFDLAGIGSAVNEFIYYNPSISNAYVIDSDMQILYGINDTQVLNVDYYTHVDTALNGTSSYYSTFVNGIPFIQFSYPIYKTSTHQLTPEMYSEDNQNYLDNTLSSEIDSTTSEISTEIPNVFSDNTHLTPSSPFPEDDYQITNNPVAALVMTYSFDQLQTEFKRLNSISPNLDAYLIDLNGRIITSSSNKAILWQNRTLDINNIMQSLDYDPSTTFELFDDKEYNGIYYKMADTGWTILITSTPHEEIEFADLLSWLFGFLGLGGVSTTQAVRARRQTFTPAPDILNVKSL